MPTPRPSRPRRGFTMIELIIVLMLLAIAAGIAAPSLKGWGMGAKLRDATQQFVSATRWARAEAAARSATIRLTVNASDNSYACTQQQDNDFVDVTGEFGQPTTLPPGFTIALVSGGGGQAGAIEFYPDLRLTPAVVRITTPTGQSSDVSCDYPAGQFKVATP